MTFDELYDILNTTLNISQEALDLAFSLCGCTEDTAKQILYYYTGYNDFAEYLRELEENY